MKKGITSTLAFELEIEVTDVAEVIFTFKEKVDSENYLLQKEYPSESVIFEDNKFKCKLTQEETDSLTNTFFVEAQINLSNKSVIKSDICKKIMPPTLWTTFVEDNESSGNEEIISLSFTDYVEGGGSGTSYTFTNGLVESSGTVGIDLASGSKLLIDANHKLDVDLSSKQDTIDSTHKLDAYLVDDSTSTNKFVTSTEKSTWSGKSKIHSAVFKSNGTLNNSLSYYDDIQRYDLIIHNPPIDDFTNNRETFVWSVESVGSQTFTAVPVNIGIVKLTTDTPPTVSDSPVPYKVGSLVATTNGKIYKCTSYEENAQELYDFTWEQLTYAKGEVDTLLGGKQDTLTIGNGIDITNNEISAKIVSSGNILKFSGGELVVLGSDIVSDSSFKNAMPYNTTIRQALTTGTNSPLQPKLTAGTNITIDSNNVISASGGSGTSYTFTNGLVESSGTVGIDLASGSKLLIDANHKLDVDLSSKQDTIDSTHKLDAYLVDDSTSTNKFVTSTEKSTWNGKADKTDIDTDTTSTTVSLTLADNHEYRYTQDLTSLTLTMPSGDFIASVVFASGSTPTSMTYDSSIKWSGDDVTNGQFVPSADKDYDIMMYYNGLNINGIVRGV